MSTEINKKLIFGPTARFITLVCLVVALFFVARIFQFDLGEIRAFFSQYPGWLSAVIFIGMYVGLTSLLWVGTMDMFRISGALIFGAYWGTLFIWIAEILNATILFYASRGLGQKFVLEKIGASKDKLKFMKNPGGFWTAFILRINPMVPFRFMDLGYGLSNIEFPKYFWAVVFGSPARIFITLFIVAAVGEAIIKDPSVLIPYVLAHKNILVMYGVYLGIVAVATITAITVGIIRNKKAKK